MSFQSDLLGSYFNEKMSCWLKIQTERLSSCCQPELFAIFPPHDYIAVVADTNHWTIRLSGCPCFHDWSSASFFKYKISHDNYWSIRLFCLMIICWKAVFESRKWEIKSAWSIFNLFCQISSKEYLNINRKFDLQQCENNDNAMHIMPYTMYFIPLQWPLLLVTTCVPISQNGF